MDMRYMTLREELYSEELGHYVSYGIRAEDGAGRTLAHISDVGLEEEKVIGLTERLNRLEVSVLHLMDIVLDSLE